MKTRSCISKSETTRGRRSARWHKINFTLDFAMSWHLKG